MLERNGKQLKYFTTKPKLSVYTIISIPIHYTIRYHSALSVPSSVLFRTLPSLNQFIVQLPLAHIPSQF